MINPNLLFNILSDQTRLRIMMLIAQEGELCVCEFISALDESQPKISRHLAFMRRAGLVSARRDGTWMYYQINKKVPKWATRLIQESSRQLKGLDPFKRDLKQISDLNLRPESQCA